MKDVNKIDNSIDNQKNSEVKLTFETVMYFIWEAITLLFMQIGFITVIVILLKIVGILDFVFGEITADHIHIELDPSKISIPYSFSWYFLGISIIPTIISIISYFIYKSMFP